MSFGENHLYNRIRQDAYKLVPAQETEHVAKIRKIQQDLSVWCAILNKLARYCDGPLVRQ